MTYVLLVGRDVALLEGLSQSLATLGHTPRVAHDLSEARQIAAAHPPLVLVVDRALASSGGAELLGTRSPRAARASCTGLPPSPLTPLLPALQRAVLADLTLPLERHRLAALVQSWPSGRASPAAHPSTPRRSRGRSSPLCGPKARKRKQREEPETQAHEEAVLPFSVVPVFSRLAAVLVAVARPA